MGLLGRVADAASGREPAFAGPWCAWTLVPVGAKVSISGRCGDDTAHFELHEPMTDRLLYTGRFAVRAECGLGSSETLEAVNRH